VQAVTMKGTLNVVTQGGRKASVVVDVIENKGVNAFEIQVNEKRLQNELNIEMFPTPYVVFLQLPSKMNEPDFRIEDEGPY
jgi:hypothetical protein